MYNAQPLDVLKFLYRAVCSHIDTVNDHYAAINTLLCHNKEKQIIKEAYNKEMAESRIELNLINEAIIDKHQQAHNLINKAINS